MRSLLPDLEKIDDLHI